MLHVQTRIYTGYIYKNIHQKRTSYHGDKNVWFYTSFYIPANQKLIFHLLHVRILGTNHCGEMRRTAFKRRELFQDVICRRNYSESQRSQRVCYRYISTIVLWLYLISKYRNYPLIIITATKNILK